MTRTLALVALAVVLVGCPGARPADTPDDAVRQALARVVARDLVAASAYVCAARRDPRDFPFPIPGIFGPVGALPGSDPGRTLDIIDLDASGISIVAGPGAGKERAVEVSGTLVERFDPTQVEALFRSYAAESGQLLDQDLLRETLANVSHGDVLLDVDETVPVIFEGGAWKVCPPAPTP